MRQSLDSAMVPQNTHFRAYTRGVCIIGFAEAAPLQTDTVLQGLNLYHK